MPTDSTNPFKAGDFVRYTPSARGRGLEVMTDLSVLVPGQIYRISSVQALHYLVLEGFEHSAGGGLSWSEFSKAEE